MLIRFKFPPPRAFAVCLTKKPVIMMTLTSMVLSACFNAKPTPVKLWIGGDVHRDDATGPLFAAPMPKLDRAHGLINLEGPVANKLSKADGSLLFNRPKSISSLSQKVRWVGVANNHSLDADRPGIIVTAKTLRQANLVPVGDVQKPVSVHENGIHYAIFNYDLWNMGDDWKNQIKDASRLGHVIVSLHSKGSPSYFPTMKAKQIVEVVLQQGATVVAVHGSHTLGPVERRGPAVIAWGLGNLSFNCPCTKEREAMLLRIDLHRSSVKAWVVPIQSGTDGGPATASLDPKGLFDLLEAIGSSPLKRQGPVASF